LGVSTEIHVNSDESSPFTGATNVGSVQVYLDEDLKTNKWNGLKVGTVKDKQCDELRLTKDIALKKGELVGQFNMGSTIVLIFEAPQTFK
jgi:phosphatidylserine decarboxylase